MKLIKFFVLITFLISCNREREKRVIKEFYENGNLKYEYQVDSNNKKNGYYHFYYENGKIKEKRKYLNDILLDDYQSFDSKGNIVYKSFSQGDSSYVLNYENNILVKKGEFLNDRHDKKNFNAWFHFFKDGKIYKKLNYVNISKDSSYLNQEIVYKKTGKIDSLKSTFFNLIIKDTVNYGENVVGKIQVCSSADVIGYFTIASDKIKDNFNNIDFVKLDTFYREDFPAFLFIPKKIGVTTLRGKFSMQYMYKEKNQMDSTKLTVSFNKRHFYFEKNIFVKDSLVKYD